MIVAWTAAGAEPSVPLSEEDVTVQKIKTVFDAAMIKSEIDKDGDLKIMDAGFMAFIKVDKEKKMIIYFSAWGLKASATELKKLQLVNRLNDDLVFVRFCLPRLKTLWCDHHLLYEGGVTPFTIVNNYRLFAKVVQGAVVAKDPDGIIGSDD